MSRCRGSIKNNSLALTLLYELLENCKVKLFELDIEPMFEPMEPSIAVLYRTIAAGEDDLRTTGAHFEQYG